MALERVCKLMIADLVVELIDEHDLRAIDIARETGWRQSDLSHMYRTAKLFPPKVRPADAPYNHFLLAAKMLSKFPELGQTPVQVFREIRRQRLTQHRDVTRHFAGLARLAAAKQLPQLPSNARNAELINRAHQSRFQDLLPRFPDRSIKILNLDPPYVYGHGIYRCGSTRSLACDSDDPASAIGMVVDVLRDWQPKLVDGGVVLLWQPWGSLRAEIAEAMDRYGWDVFGPVIWDKSRPQPGQFDTAYSVQGEMLWVLHPQGDVPRNHDGSSRQAILRVPPVSYPGRAHEQEHCFEKPADLCELLIRKHSHPGELVFDACGCTGTMTVAAVRLKRRWVYAESNAENYGIGRDRIGQVLRAAAPHDGHV